MEGQKKRGKGGRESERERENKSLFYNNNSIRSILKSPSLQKCRDSPIHLRHQLSLLSLSPSWFFAFPSRTISCERRRRRGGSGNDGQVKESKPSFSQTCKLCSVNYYKIQEERIGKNRKERVKKVLMREREEERKKELNGNESIYNFHVTWHQVTLNFGFIVFSSQTDWTSFLLLKPLSFSFFFLTQGEKKKKRKERNLSSHDWNGILWTVSNKLLPFLLHRLQLINRQTKWYPFFFLPFFHILSFFLYILSLIRSIRISERREEEEEWGRERKRTFCSDLKEEKFCDPKLFSPIFFFLFLLSFSHPLSLNSFFLSFIRFQLFYLNANEGGEVSSRVWFSVLQNDVIKGMKRRKWMERRKRKMREEEKMSELLNKD